MTYRVKVPAEMPVKKFWALTVYDRATFDFIYTESSRTTLSTYDLEQMKKEAGSVYLYVEPEAPKGLETNWIPTGGKHPYPLIRFYGATDALNATEPLRCPTLNWSETTQRVNGSLVCVIIFAFKAPDRILLPTPCSCQA